MRKSKEMRMTGIRKINVLFLVSVLVVVFLIEGSQSDTKFSKIPLNPNCSKNRTNNAHFENNGVLVNETLSINEILEMGQTLYGDSGTPTTSPFPCWFNPELARIGQKFAAKYQAQVSLAHLLSLLMLLGNPQVRQVMYATRKSETPDKAFKRYTATGLHVGIWYQVDVLHPTWLKSVQTIRQIHKGVGSKLKSMNKNGEFEKPLVTKENNPTGFYPDEKMWAAFNLDLEASEHNPKLKQRRSKKSKVVSVSSVVGNSNSSASLKIRASENLESSSVIVHKPTKLYNQFLMSITQWSFVAMPILFPSQLGFPQWSILELRGFYHLWAVISHLLGMNEEFILCRDPDDFYGCKKYLNEIYETYMIPSLFDIDFQGKLLIESILRAPKFLVPSTPVDFMLIQLLEDIVNIPATNLYAQAPWQTRVGRFFAKHFSEPFFHWPIVQKASNFLLSGEIQLASKRTFGDAGTNLTAVAEQYYI